MVRVPCMGMSRDLAQRVSLAHVDDVDRRSRVWRSVCTKNILGPQYKRGCQIHELE